MSAPINQPDEPLGTTSKVPPELRSEDAPGIVASEASCGWPPQPPPYTALTVLVQARTLNGDSGYVLLNRHGRQTTATAERDPPGVVR